MILVLGSGVAGLSCALAAARAGTEVMLVTPGSIDRAEGHASARAGGNTALAQGGIAAALSPGDSVEAHLADTLGAGAGLVDAEAARVLCREGVEVMRRCIAQGFPADRDREGKLIFGQEAAHRSARIVHAGEDRTGAALHAFLAQHLLTLVNAGRVQLAEQSTAVSVLTDAGAVSGAVLRDAEGHLSAVSANALVIATGGYGALYQRTSNHSGARGQGVLLAAHAGAAVADLEFVQFHPTVLEGTGFLISEAVRGAGAVLRNDRGERFMTSVHEAAELAPRDIVSRAAHRVLTGGSRVWLDATAIERQHGAGTLAQRFPTITATTRAHGVNWAREAVAVTPAAHYSMGGVVSDLEGRTSVPGLFVAGEAAATGVHGANRLASNSLLEGLVFGTRAALASASYARPLARGGKQWVLWGSAAAQLVAQAETFARVDRSPAPSFAGAVPHDDSSNADATVVGWEDAAPGQTLSAAVDRHLAIERDEAGLRQVSLLARAQHGDEAELVTMVAQSALARQESRGAHYRTDAPRTDPQQQARRAWFSSATKTSASHGPALTPQPASSHPSSSFSRSISAC